MFSAKIFSGSDKNCRVRIFSLWLKKIFKIMLVKYRGKKISFLLSEDGRRWDIPQELGQIIIMCRVVRSKDANPFDNDNWRFQIVDRRWFAEYGWDLLPAVSVRAVSSHIYSYDEFEMAQHITDDMIDRMNVSMGEIRKWRQRFVKEMRRLGKEMPWKKISEDYIQECLTNCDESSIRGWITQDVKPESCAYDAVCC